MPNHSPEKIDNILPFVRTLPMFAGLSADTLQNLAGCSNFFIAETGSNIFTEGSPANGGYFVSTGRVVLRKSTFRDNKLTLELLGPQDAFGVVSAAKGDPYPLTSEVLSEAVCLHIEQECLLRLASSEPTVMEQLLDICASRMQRSHRLMAALADAESDTRISGALLVFAEKFGSELEKGIEVEVTRQELASLAVTSVETAIRVTRSFEDRGWISFPRTKQILIANRPALEELCLKRK